MSETHHREPLEPLRIVLGILILSGLVLCVIIGFPFLLLLDKLHEHKRR